MSNSNNRSRKRISKWTDIWILPVMILISLIPLVLLFRYRSGWLFYIFLSLGLFIFGLAFILSMGLLWLRWRYWPGPDEPPIYLEDDRVYQGERLIAGPRPDHEPETWATYRRLCRQYMQLTQEEHPGWAMHDYAEELGCTRPQLSRAIQAWRAGWLDDRPWWPRTRDYVTGRSRFDHTRYLPDH